MDEGVLSTQPVVLEARKDLKDAVRTGGQAVAVLRVQRQRREAARGHGPAHLPFEEGLDQQNDEVEEEEGLDAALVLEEHGGDRVHELELLVALLQPGLVFVGREDLGQGEITIVGDEREDAVAPRVVLYRKSRFRRSCQ